MQIWNPRLNRRDLIKLGLITLANPRVLFSAEDSWSFAVFSDTHFGVAGNAEKNRVLLAEIAARNPAHAVLAGDLTERAWPVEFDEVESVLTSSPLKTYVAPGNHDVRWAPRGLTLFQERVGPSRQLVMHRGCAFLLLDSTVPLSHWGHIGGPQRRWIVEQLNKLERATPLFVFMHHPVGRASGIDDDADQDP
jgi:3',5'-cyclic AMP phosphodiesterase CpdA